MWIVLLLFSGIAVVGGGMMFGGELMATGNLTQKKLSGPPHAVPKAEWSAWARQWSKSSHKAATTQKMQKDHHGVIPLR